MSRPLNDCMLAATVDKPFDSPDHIFEWKFNGMRILGMCNGSTVLQGRSGLDYTAQFPEIHHLHKQLKVPAHVDGEVVCLDENGLPSFNRLQQRIGKRTPLDIKLAAEKFPATFKVFDVPEVEGKDLTITGLRAKQMQRKDILSRILVPDEHIQISSWVDGKGIELYEKVESLEQEGIMAKTKSGLYHPGGRVADWQKIKVPRIGLFVVCGFTKGKGWREDLFGALILGLPKDGGIDWVGNAGTGKFGGSVMHDILETLRKIPASQSPLLPGRSKISKVAGWVQPLLIAEVKYGDLTNDGMLIGHSFQRIRTDLNLSDCCYRIPKEV